jgi:predicted lipid-binding transport protein (Tim44 family)
VTAFSSRQLVLDQRNGAMSGSALEILVLVGAVAFIAFRLYSVLGRRTGNERPPFDPVNQRERAEPRRPAAGAKDGNVIQLPRSRDVPARPVVDSVMANVAPGSALAVGVAGIQSEDPAFDPDAFVSGAKIAHEMVVRAYADGDRESLKQLLSPDVFASFEGVIRTRELAGHHVDFSFVGLKQASLEEATMRGRFAEVTMRFVSELVGATRDATGVVIEGAAGVVREVTDVWTFARDVGSRDKNWKVIATAGGA